MKGNAMNQVCWYRRGMNHFLSEKGFIHFSAGEAMSEDFKEGVPYFFNYADKTFGKCELVFDSVKADEISRGIVSKMENRQP